MNQDILAPIHPGEVLLEEFLKPMELSQNQLALAIRVPQQHIQAIIDQQQPVTADIALRLAHYFGISPKFWLGLQMDYDLDITEDELGQKLRQEIRALN